MRLDLNVQSAKILDFMFVIIYKYNNKSNYDKLFGPFEKDENIISSLEYIWEGLNMATPGLALFFKSSDERKVFMQFKYATKIYSFKTIEELIDDFIKGDVNQLQLQLLKYFDDNINEENYYKEMTIDPIKLYSFIDNLDLSDRMKLELAGMVINPQSLLNELDNFFKVIAERLREVYIKNSKLIKDFEIKLKNKIDTESLDLVELGIINNPDDDINIKVTYSFFSKYILYSRKHKKNMYVIMGLEYEQLVEYFFNNNNIEDIEKFLKSIADKNRLEIILLLLKKEMYVGDISKELDIPVSTVAYYLEILSNAGIVGKKLYDNRTYYILKKRFAANKLDLITSQIFESI